MTWASSGLTWGSGSDHGSVLVKGECGRLSASPQRGQLRVKHLLTTVIRSFAVFFAGTMLCLSTVGQAAAEVRTISLYHVHTRESLTITYKKDLRYIPSAMAQINYLLR